MGLSAVSLRMSCAHLLLGMLVTRKPRYGSTVLQWNLLAKHLRTSSARRVDTFVDDLPVYSHDVEKPSALPGPLRSGRAPVKPLARGPTHADNALHRQPHERFSWPCQQAQERITL